MSSALAFFSIACLALALSVLGFGFWDAHYRVDPLPAWLVLMCLGAAGALVHGAFRTLDSRTRELELARVESRLLEIRRRHQQD